MKLSIINLLLFSILCVSAQDKTISKSYFIGSWKQNRFYMEGGKRIQVYVRVQNDAKSSFGITKFKADGSFEVIFSRAKPVKCGNDHSRRPKNSQGTYTFDSNQQQLKFINNRKNDKTDWNIVWLDENTFGRIIPKN